MPTKRIPHPVGQRGHKMRQYPPRYYTSSPPSKLTPHEHQLVEWWRVIGKHPTLSTEFTTARATILDRVRAMIPQTATSDEVDSSIQAYLTNLSHPDILAMVGQMSRRLAERYPRLALYSPQLESSHILTALFEALRMGWDAGGWRLVLAALDIRRALGSPVSAEVWQIVMQTDGVLPSLDKATPVLLRRLWHNGTIVDHRQCPAILLTLWPGATQDDARAALIDAWTVAKDHIAPLSGVRQNHPSYATMMAIYQDWHVWQCAHGGSAADFLASRANARQFAGETDDTDDTNDGKYSSEERYLTRARAWLDPA